MKEYTIHLTYEGGWNWRGQIQEPGYGGSINVVSVQWAFTERGLKRKIKRRVKELRKAEALNGRKDSTYKL